MVNTVEKPQEQLKIGARPLEAADAAALKATCWPSLNSATACEHVRSALSLAGRGRMWPYVGLYDDRPVGFGKLARWQNAVEICNLAVGDKWRSLGVGTAMVNHLVEVARQLDFAWVEIGVAKANPRALALYRRLGFVHRERERILDLGKGMEPVTYLSRELNDIRLQSR